MTTQLYTTSRLRTIRSCLRLHLYKYVLAIRAPETDVMRFGTVGHKALEAYYRAWKEAPSCEDARDDAAASAMRHDKIDARLRAALAELDAADLPTWDRIKLRLLVVAYDARWGGEDWEVLEVEVEFRFMLGDELIGGKIDAIIRDRKDGRIYVVEHKTTGVDASLGSAYWEKLTIDTQVSIYVDGATMLGYEVAGCIYDVLKRPGHEPKLATPVEVRKYTVGKGCKRCGGSAKPGAVAKGRGGYDVVFGAEVKIVTCDECDGTGWKKNKDGVPEAPRLHSNQHDTDESAEAFEARLVEAIAENPDAMLLRGVVVRLEDELPVMRQDLLDVIALEQMRVDVDGVPTRLAPRNPDACARRGELCEFFDACAGRADINDETRFPRGLAHPELAAAT